jgi:hypothetical protein
MLSRVFLTAIPGFPSAFPALKLHTLNLPPLHPIR